MSTKPFITALQPGTIRNNFAGKVGCLIEVHEPIVVTALGRIVAPGFTGQAHNVRLISQSWGIELAIALVSTAGGTAGQFTYTDLVAPLLLSPGRYYLVTQEAINYDPWYSSDTVVTAYESEVSVLAAAFEHPILGIQLDYGDAHSFGPANFKFKPYAESTLITGFTPGTTSNGYDGYLGCIFETKTRHLKVTALGRYALAGSSHVHTLRLVNLWTNELIREVGLNLAGTAANGWRYTELDEPVILPPFSQFVLISTEASGGDSWYTGGTPVTSDTLLGSDVAQIQHSVAYNGTTGSIEFLNDGSVCYGPLNLKIEAIKGSSYLHATGLLNRVHLVWEQVEGAARYMVERSAQASSGFVQLAEVDVTTYDDSGAACGVLYYYRVIPIMNGGGDGPTSPVAQVYVPATSCPRLGVRVASGLLLRETFDDRLGESSGALSVIAAPSFVSFTPSRVPVVSITDYLHEGTARQGQIVQDGDQWLAFYDAAMPPSALPVPDADHRNYGRPQYKVSLDKGLTWQKLVYVSIHNRKHNDYAETVGHAMGYFEVRGGTWYATLLRGTDADKELSVGPFYGDQFSAPSPYGPWTWVREVAPETYYGSCVVKEGSTYYLFLAQLETLNVYIVSGPSPTGPWTLPGTAALPNSIKGKPENPKVFYSSALARWVNLTNQISEDGSRTDKNRAFFAASIEDWLAATYCDFQHICPLDALQAIGVPSPIYKAEGLVVEESNGFVPFTFDGNGQDGNHYYRQVYYGVLEPSKNALSFNNTSGTVSSKHFDVEHEDFSAEFAVEFDSSVAGAFVSFDFRMSADGLNGYRLKIIPGDTLILYKVVDGAESVIQDAGLGTIVALGLTHRVLVQAEGNNLTAQINGELQVALGDSTYGRGSRVQLSAKNCHARVRLLHIRRSDTVTIRNVTVGARVVLRGAGDIPIAEQTASELTVKISHSHFPAKSIEIDGRIIAQPDEGVWGGDEYRL